MNTYVLENSALTCIVVDYIWAPTYRQQPLHHHRGNGVLGIILYRLLEVVASVSASNEESVLCADQHAGTGGIRNGGRLLLQ